MRKLLVSVLLLAALLVVADRVAAHVTQGVLARQLTAELGTRPSVELGGFPFLTQAVAGRYTDVRLRAARVERSGVSLTGFSAALAGVDVPLSDAVRGKVDAVPVQRLSASGVLSYAELQRLAGKGLTIAPDPRGVRVSGTVRVLGQNVAASAVSSVTLQGDEVMLRAGDVEVDGIRPTGAIARALAGRLDLDVRLPTLPYDVRLSSVQPGPTGIAVSGTARDIVLRRG